MLMRYCLKRMATHFWSPCCTVGPSTFGDFTVDVPRGRIELGWFSDSSENNMGCWRDRTRCIIHSYVPVQVLWSLAELSDEISWYFMLIFFSVRRELYQDNIQTQWFFILTYGPMRSGNGIPASHITSLTDNSSACQSCLRHRILPGSHWFSFCGMAVCMLLGCTCYSMGLVH